MNDKEKLLKVNNEIKKLLKDNNAILYPDVDDCNIILEISGSNEYIIIN